MKNAAKNAVRTNVVGTNVDRIVADRTKVSKCYFERKCS